MTNRSPSTLSGRAREVCVLGSAEPGSPAYESLQDLERNLREPGLGA